MSGAIISVVNRKGGVGKTTLTLGLADTLIGQTEQPYDPAESVVVVVDLDPQASLTRALLYDRSTQADGSRLGDEIMNRPNLAKALEDRIPCLEPRSTRNRTPVSEYLTHGIGPTGFSYSMLPNESRAWNVERRALKKPGEAKLKLALHELLGELASTFKYVLIDCPPGQTVLAEGAIQKSDLVLCPIVADFLSYWGLESFDEYLRELFKEADQERPPARYVFTKYKPKAPRYDPQNRIIEMVARPSEVDRYVTLLKEAGGVSLLTGEPIKLQFDPRIASRLEGAPSSTVRWLLNKMYTTPTQKGLEALALAVKKELNGG